jgi:hypothetical protein
MMTFSVTGRTKQFGSSPATVQAFIQANFNATPIGDGTGILITVEANEPHVIQFVDRSLWRTDFPPTQYDTTRQYSLSVRNTPPM